jgi:hypothetical protein
MAESAEPDRERATSTDAAYSLEEIVARYGALLLPALASLVLLASLGLRDSWPADEPRRNSMRHDPDGS